ncbi:MAG: glycoside hydrolase family 88 protein [Acetatifactor sp.]|nr:glycoside hydrolase family 88 protein [Acetatifactor sp.]
MGFQYQEALDYALQIVEQNLEQFVDRYPHVSEGNIYSGEENNLWTDSFYPGMCYLAYDVTGDSKYIKHEKDYLASFAHRLHNRIGISHDLGFLYTLSCVADYKLTGSKEAYELAMEAAQVLSERYNEKGKYIQAWGEMGIGYPDVKIIIDTMMNLPLLYWTGQEKYFEIARNHARTAAQNLIRKDYSSYHVYLMDPTTGRAVEGKTHQGYQDESTWARGQAWAVYGFAISYRYTQDKEFLEVSQKTAQVFLEHLPKDYVCYWDFTFTDENPDIRDTSAAAIFVCGLLELCQFVDEEQAKEYRKWIDMIMTSLSQKYTTKGMKGTNGILAEGMYHRNSGADECVIWGDYFYMEALVRMKKEWKSFW